ncbi:hypothetical protein S101258_01194 [Lactiplantibacillus plantarum subsp. plantarum]|uniref:Uncharacterized protein n=1 Tax=Lactiplantibacillus plantarum subsp. plantarum TaxID=337330 RepID=A0A2S3U6Z3_LACPN|nr:hypothetical protein S101258_01194 [Lactiplantibacillus plantarum subsp. plantarum]
MSKTYRWAIVGLGNIAHSFVKYFDQPDEKSTPFAHVRRKKLTPLLPNTTFPKLMVI